MAGKTLIGILRNIWNEDHINWVEALPQVIRAYHDTAGDSGLSPFNIVFGRHRSDASIPYEPLRECETATTFFDRMDHVDKIVANSLNEKNKAEMARINVNGSKKTPFQVNEWVWVLRPKSTYASKLDTWWIGPAKILRRVGDQSYEVQLKPNVTQDVHINHLKPFVEDRVQGKHIE